MVEWGDLNFGEGGIGSGHGDSLRQLVVRGLSAATAFGKFLVCKFVVTACGFPNPVFVNQGL